MKRHAGDRTVLGSGDLFTAADCLRMLRQTGVDGVTVARGAIGNPWIFREVRALAAGKPLPAPPSVHEQREVILEHFALAERVYGESKAGRQMRKFGIKYAQLHPEPQQVRDAFVEVKCREDWHRAVARWYSEDGPGRRPLPEDIHKAQGSDTPGHEAAATLTCDV
ncbi:MAG: tRNA-dihydrouridine synthase [Pirellulales bacterium]